MQTYPQYYPQMNNYGQQYNLHSLLLSRISVIRDATAVVDAHNRINSPI